MVNRIALAVSRLQVGQFANDLNLPPAGVGKCAILPKKDAILRISRLTQLLFLH